MNIVKKIDQYDENNCFFCEPIKNNVINDGTFIRIIYSTHNVVLNGIYLLLTLNDISSEKYYTQYNCCYIERSTSKNNNKWIKNHCN